MISSASDLQAVLDSQGPAGALRGVAQALEIAQDMFPGQHSLGVIVPILKQIADHIDASGGGCGHVPSTDA